MVRVPLQRALVVLLLAALLAPVLEAFDRWDATPGLAGDTEFHVAVLAMSAGLLAAVALVVARIPSTAVSVGKRFESAVWSTDSATPPTPFFLGNSPPNLPLRI